MRCPDATEAGVENFHTHDAQVVGAERQAWMQSHASLICGKVRSTSVTTPVMSKPFTSTCPLASVLIDVESPVLHRIQPWSDVLSDGQIGANPIDPAPLLISLMAAVVRISEATRRSSIGMVGAANVAVKKGTSAQA